MAVFPPPDCYCAQKPIDDAEIYLVYPFQVGDFGRSVVPNQLGLPNFMPPNDFVRM